MEEGGFIKISCQPPCNAIALREVHTLSEMSHLHLKPSTTLLYGHLTLNVHKISRELKCPVISLLKA